jgi:ubiquinone biosynthesis protein
MAPPIRRGPWLDLSRSGKALWHFARLGGWILARRLGGSPASPAEIGRRLRQTLEHMGVTYVKLGQFLAIRFDLLHPDLARELSNLFDAVPPAPEAAIRTIIEEEFGQSTDELFSDFDWASVAAASIAQVHRARLFSGDVVAVKVQRPLVREMFAADIRFFRIGAWIVDHLFPLGAISLADGVKQFESFTVREMDFLEEARTCERVRRSAGPHESAPRVYWELTRMRVLTMEFERGAPLSTIIRLIEQDRRDELERLVPETPLPEIVRRLANACFRQIFEQGFFHADPHPGNIFVRRDGTVVFLDFGIFGHLTSWELDTLSNFVAAAAVGNTAGSLHYFSKLLIPREGTDISRLKRDLSAVINRWQAAVRDLATAPEARHFGRYVNEFLSEARRHGTGMSLETLLFWRALVALNGTALRVDPKTDVLRLLGSFFARKRFAMLARRFSAAGLALGARDALRLPRPRALLPGFVSEIQKDEGDRRRANRDARFTAAALLGAAILILAIVGVS